MVKNLEQTNRQDNYLKVGRQDSGLTNKECKTTLCLKMNSN